MVTFENEAEQDKRLDFLRKQEEEELARVLSNKYGLEYLDLSLISISSEALKLVPEAEARDAEIAAFGRVGKKIRVGGVRPKIQNQRRHSQNSPNLATK